MIKTHIFYYSKLKVCLLVFNNYATGVIYFQYCEFQYRITRKLNQILKLNVSILMLKYVILKLNYASWVITGKPVSKLLIGCNFLIQQILVSK